MKTTTKAGQLKDCLRRVLHKLLELSEEPGSSKETIYYIRLKSIIVKKAKQNIKKSKQKKKNNSKNTFDSTLHIINVIGVNIK